MIGSLPDHHLAHVRAQQEEQGSQHRDPPAAGHRKIPEKPGAKDKQQSSIKRLEPGKQEKPGYRMGPEQPGPYEQLELCDLVEAMDRGPAPVEDTGQVVIPVQLQPAM